MRRFWGYLLGVLLVLPLLLALPACKSTEKGAEKLTGVAEKMKQGTAGEALEELEEEEGETDEDSDDLEGFEEDF
jgi:hypothetical protein